MQLFNSLPLRILLVLSGPLLVFACPALADSTIPVKRLHHNKQHRTFSKATAIDTIGKVEPPEPAQDDTASGHSSALYVIVVVAVTAYIIAKCYPMFFQSTPDTAQVRRQLPHPSHKAQLDGPWHDRDFFLTNYLGFGGDISVTESQLSIIEALMRSLDSYQETEEIARLNGIGGTLDPLVIHRILKNAVVAKGGLIEFIQIWLLKTFPHHTVLFAAEQLPFEQLIETLRYDSFEEDPDPIHSEVDEERQSKPEPLTVIFPIYAIRLRVNGHSSEWTANNDLSELYPHLVNWSFAEALLSLPKIVWREAILNDFYFNSKVWFTNEKGKVLDFVKKNDIVRARESLLLESRSKPKSIRHSSQSSTPIKRFDPVLEKLDSDARLRLKKEKGHSNIDRSSQRSAMGYEGAVYPNEARAGIPCAVINGNKIFAGYTPVPPHIGLLEKDQICQGMFFITARVVANYKESDQLLYEGLLRGHIIARHVGGVIYDEHYTLLGSYRGPDSGMPLAMAFLLGLLD
jgi:hypothetical protein